MARNWAQIHAIKQNMNLPQELTSNGMIFPNNSGEHVQSIKRETPVSDISVANKAYVDSLGVAHLAAYDHTLLANINQDVKTTASPGFTKISVSSGSVSAPSITFQDDENTGFYKIAGGDLRLAIDGVNRSAWDVGAHYTDSIKSLTAATLDFKGQPTDGASAIAIKLNSTPFTKAGAKLVSIQNNGTEKAYIDKDGGFYGASNIVSGLSVYGARFYASTATSAIISGQAVNGATAIAHKIGNLNALTTTGAKIASFYSDNFSTEKAYIDKDGIIVAETNMRVACGGGVTDSTTTASGSVTLSINGTTYRLLYTEA